MSRGDERASDRVLRPGRLGADLLSGLGAALIWSAAVVARVSGEGPAGATFVAALGCAALSLGVVVAVARRALPLSRAGVIVASGAALGAAPLAVLGAVLRTHTHHRALGAVTYVLVALAVLVLAMAVTRRLVALASGASSAARAARAALLVSCAVSLGWVALGLRGALGAGGAPGVSAVVTDGAIGVAVATLAVFSWRARLSPSASRAAGAAWAAVVIVGLIVVRQSPRALATLAERAPVALGVGGWLFR